MSAIGSKVEIKKSELKAYLLKGITYQAYKQQMAEDLALNPDMKMKEYIHLNQRRMHRVEQTYVINEALVEQLETLKNKMHWLVITEHWCGDAAQSLGVLHKIASNSDGKIDLRFVYRDQNSELMNAYLTNGTKSIPKLIQLDEHYNVTGIWGPRPTIAQELVKTLKADPTTADSYSTALHSWYAKDKQVSMEKEILKLLQRANNSCTNCTI